MVMEPRGTQRKGKGILVEKKKRKHNHLSTLFQPDPKRQRGGITIQEGGRIKKSTKEDTKKSIKEAKGAKEKEKLESKSMKQSSDDDITPFSTYLNLDRFGSVKWDIKDILERNEMTLLDMIERVNPRAAHTRTRATSHVQPNEDGGTAFHNHTQAFAQEEQSGENSQG